MVKVRYHVFVGFCVRLCTSVALNAWSVGELGVMLDEDGGVGNGLRVAKLT